MSLGNHAWQGDVDAVDTTQVYDLGRLRAVTPQEMADWTGVRYPGLARYVENDSGAAAAWAVGNPIGRLDTTVSGGVGIRIPANADVSELLGVAQHVIASGSFGWILVQGIGEVLADAGGIAENTALIVGDAVGTAGNAVAPEDDTFAYAHETVVAGNLATCSIHCPVY